MAKKIVFLNLADKHHYGLHKKAANALRKKYPRYGKTWEYFCGTNEVQVVDLFSLLEAQRNPRSIRSLNDLTVFINTDFAARHHIRELCKNASKIMLGIHGHYDDTSQGFAGQGLGRGSGPAGNYREFARLISSLLLPDKTYKLALVICFAARSANFRKNHEGTLRTEDIKSSFAYKFYKEICRDRKITMTARIGSVSFNSKTGHSLVQTEAATRAKIDLDELRAAAETKRIAKSYSVLQSFLCKSEEELKKFMAMEKRMEALDAVPRNQREQIIQSFLRQRRQIKDLNAASRKNRSKYGKFVYTYSSGEIAVFRKYVAGKNSMALLYQGAP